MQMRTTRIAVGIALSLPSAPNARLQALVIPRMRALLSRRMREFLAGVMALGPYSLHRGSARILRHTRSGVAGISMWLTPSPASASTIALITAASAGVVPPSPPERTPSLFVGDGTSLSAVDKKGSVSARGIA